MFEEWKEVYGFDVLYEVSNTGKVRTKHHPGTGYTNEYRYVEPCDNGNGYLRFNWKVGRRQKTVYLHRLVAEAFVENPNGYTEINHKDEDKSNNCFDNLEWCEHIYNCRYGTRNDRLAEMKSNPVRCVDNGIEFRTVREAAKWAQVGTSAIYNCVLGLSKTSGGHRWEWA